MSLRTYSDSYFAPAADVALSSAEAIVPLLMAAVAPTSVVDVGCGIGAWLAAFQRAGVTTTVGVDGEYHPHEYQVTRQAFVAHNLTQPFVMPPHLPQRFDLAISLEVAEHLPEQAAATFAKTLTSLAPVVMFSAAVPHQGGKGHVNEQWPEYWARFFDACGYDTVDYVRPRVWNNSQVAFYYAQNLLLYVDRGSRHRFPLLAGSIVAIEDGALARIHPRKWMAANDPRRQSLKKVLTALPHAVTRAVRGRKW